MTDYVTDVQL